MILSDADLARLQALEQQATPTPWREGHNLGDKDNFVADVRGLHIYGPYKAVACGDERRFIIESRNALPALLAELVVLRRVAEAAEPLLRRWLNADELENIELALTAYHALKEG